MSAPMDDMTRIEKSACLLAECGKKGTECWALQEVLDKLIESVGPWWIANYIEGSDNQAANEALMNYLETQWPAEAETVAQLLAALHWRSAKSNFEKDFGGD